MTTSKARAFTSGALLELQSALAGAATHEDFLAQADAVIARSANVLELPFDTGAAEQLDPGSEGAQGRDASNAPLVYEFLGAMDPANASDERLWTFLAFATYRDYMEKRWPLVGENWRGRAETRWMMPRVSRGKLVRHGIARLWWVASLTYDPKSEHRLARDSGDPFAYTRAVLANEDRVLALFDREAGAVQPLVRVVMEHLAEDPSRRADSYVRDLMKEVTLVYGYRDLAALDETRLRQVVDRAAPA